MQRQTTGRICRARISVDHLHPNTTDWFGRYRMVEAEENDYLIDRDGAARP